MSTNFIYLHGFGSSPNSKKAVFLNNKLKSWGFHVVAPDLNVPDFPNLSLTAMAERVAQTVRACPAGPVFIVAASMGASAAVLFMNLYGESEGRRVEKILLLAPSFDFVENRRRQLGQQGIESWANSGWLPYFHHDYERTIDLSHSIINDVNQYDLYGMDPGIPIYIIHGIQDTNVDCSQSVRFAQECRSATIELVEGKHSLSNQFNRIWSVVVDFFKIYDFFQYDMSVKVRKFDFSGGTGFQDFYEYKDEFFNLLQICYKEKYIGHDVHMNRILDEGRTIYLAFAKNDNQLVGGSFISPAGKRGALAVREDFQGKGIGRRLIKESLIDFPSQFTELREADNRMVNLVGSFGFYPANLKSQIDKHLFNYVHLMTNFNKKDDCLVYKRQSSSRVNMKHEFILFLKEPIIEMRKTE